MVTSQFLEWVVSCTHGTIIYGLNAVATPETSQGVHGHTWESVMNVCASYVTDVKGTVALALEGFSFVSVSTLWCLAAMCFGM